MNMPIPRLRFSLLALIVLAGCAGAPRPECVPECAECRDLAVQELKVHRSGRHFQSGSRLPRVHACSCCKVEVTLYEESGKPMLRCPKCALILPRKSGQPPKEPSGSARQESHGHVPQKTHA